MSKLFIKNRFATIPNELLNNEEVSLKAKGLYAFIQSKPEDWDFSVLKIASQLKEGREAVIGALQELETARFLHRQKYKNELGQWDCDYTLYCEPYENLPLQQTHYSKSVNGEAVNISKKEEVKKNSNNTLSIKGNFEKIESFKSLPTWEMKREVMFKSLTDSEIDLYMDNYLLSYPDSKIVSILNMLEEKHNKKSSQLEKDEKFNKKIAEMKPLNVDKNFKNYPNSSQPSPQPPREPSRIMSAKELMEG